MYINNSNMRRTGRLTNKVSTGAHMTSHQTYYSLLRNNRKKTSELLEDETKMMV